MNFGLIEDTVTRHIKLNLTDLEYFFSLLKYRMIRKKQFLLNVGEICDSSAFVTSGCLRGFTTDSNGLEHVLHFAPAGWWIADMYSLISGQPGFLNIEAMEDTEVLLLPKIAQELLYEKVPLFERYFRIITENSLVANHQRLVDSLSLTAEERYMKFCKSYPTLINQIPQKHIASYIGVTAEFLSRMRTNMLKNK